MGLGCAVRPTKCERKKRLLVKLNIFGNSYRERLIKTSVLYIYMCEVVAAYQGSIEGVQYQGSLSTLLNGHREM